MTWNVGDPNDPLTTPRNRLLQDINDRLPLAAIHRRNRMLSKNNLTKLTTRIMGWPELKPGEFAVEVWKKTGNRTLAYKKKFGHRWGWFYWEKGQMAEPWEPMTNLINALELAAKARSDGFHITFQSSNDGVVCMVESDHTDINFSVTENQDQDKLPEIITLAILSAYMLIDGDGNATGA